MKEYTYLIIGNSAAGISAINKLWQLDPTASILCISEEQEQPYNKCFLADYLSGQKEQTQLFTKLLHKNAQFSFGK
jgi:NAD(P)H-nitrite reductase large subunit